MRKRKKRYRLTKKGKITLGIIGSTFILLILFVVLIKQGIFSYADPQIISLTSDQSTIPIYADATSSRVLTYVTSDPHYGADAALIRKKYHRYEIQLAGCVGYVDEENVMTYENETLYPSYYERTEDGSLMHHISADLTSPYYFSIVIGKAPDFMEVGKAYYSYDGHAFYSNTELLLNDLRNKSEANRVNSVLYYNYYQYLPLHSSSFSSASLLNEWLYVKKNDAYYNSVLADQAQLFFDAQEMNSINALLVYGIAMNESRFGTSIYAVSKNNLFGYNAVDSNPDQADTFESIQDCINQYMEIHLNQGYLYNQDQRYHGSHLGDKGSGMNVFYASDPYWGEKAAGYAYAIDAYNGFIEAKMYQLAIQKEAAVDVMSEMNGEVIAQLDENLKLPVIVLEETSDDKGRGWYKIQLDSAVSFPYVMEEAIGYVPARYFILNE